MKEIIVNGCHDCPLVEWEIRQCHLTETLVGKDYDEGRLAEDCPLRRHSEIRLRLKGPRTGSKR